MSRRVTRIIVLALCTLAAVISLIQGIRNALHLSADLQWTDVVLLRQHQDPFQVYLSGDPEHLLMQWQIPNYLHEMYAIELPLAWVSFPTAEGIWIAVNLLLLAASLAMLIRIYGLTRREAPLYVALVLCSTGFRNTLGLGQQSFFALFCFCAIIWLDHRSTFRSALALGGLYAKYSFAPVLFGYLLARRQFRILALSFVLPAIGYVVVLVCIHGQHPWRLLIEPFLVSRYGVGPGKADIMTFIEHISAGRAAMLLAYLLGLCIALSYGWFVHRSGLSLPAAAAGIAAATLICVKHVEYDLLFLILPMAFFLKRRDRYAAIALTILGYLFYVDRWIPVHSIIPDQAARIVYFLLIVSIVILVHLADRVDRQAVAASLPTCSSAVKGTRKESLSLATPVRSAVERAGA
jgi:hypothetical protein